MKSENKSIIGGFSSLTLGMGMLQADLDLIERYNGAVLATGLESLDAPSDVLVSKYLANTYPSYYKLGDGSEGIKDLIEKIKSGIKGMKNILKSGKPDPIITKSTAKITDELAKTYGSADWAEKQKFEFGKVKVPELAKVVAGTTVEEVDTALTSQIDLFNETLDTQLATLRAYWNKAEKPLEKVISMGESGKTDGDDFKNALEALMKVIGNGNPAEAKETSLPEFPVGSEPSYQALTKETVKPVSDMIDKIMKACNKLEDMACNGRLEDAAGQEIEIDWGDAVSKDEEKKIFALYFDVLQDGPSVRANLMCEHLFNVAKALEQWILASLK